MIYCSKCGALTTEGLCWICVHAAQVGRNAKRQDREDGLGPKDEHAVAEGDAPNPADAQRREP